MKSSPLVCMKCLALIPAATMNTGAPRPCPGCAKPTEAYVFPALFQDINPVPAPELLVESTETACFYHPNHRAVEDCRQCGRLLCPVCDLPFQDEHLCPICVQSNAVSRRAWQFVPRRVLYDNLALSLALIPIVIPVFWYLPITSPLALMLVFWKWNDPGSVLRGRSKWKMILACILAVLMLAAGIAIWCFFIYVIIAKPN